MQHCPATTSPLKCVVVSSVEQPTTSPVLPSKKAVDWKGIGASDGWAKAKPMDCEERMVKQVQMTVAASPNTKGKSLWS